MHKLSWLGLMEVMSMSSKKVPTPSIFLVHILILIELSPFQHLTAQQELMNRLLKLLRISTRYNRKRWNT